MRVATAVAAKRFGFELDETIECRQHDRFAEHA
jgi:hypothetical protein